MLIEENISVSSASEIKNQPAEGLTLVKKEVYDEEPTEWFTMVNYDIIPTAPEEIDYNPEYAGSAPTTKDVKDEPQQIEELEHEEIDIKDEPLENASKKVGRKRGKAKAEEQVFQCHNCGFKTTNKATLKSHVKFHSRRKPFACNICSYKTVDKSNLSSHMKIHTGEKPHQCSHCGYKTTSKYYLMQHETIHVGTKLFKCDICGHETRYRNCLSRHMRRHTGEKSPERIYLCDHCDYHCKCRKQLNRHKLKHSDEKPFECSECEYRTKLKHSLTRHIKRKHLCEIIGIDHVKKRVIVKNALHRIIYNLHPHDLPEDFNTSAYYANGEKYLAEIKQLRKLLPQRQTQSVVAEVAPTVNTVQRNELPAYASHNNNNQSLIQQSVNSASGPGRNVGQVTTAPCSNNEQGNEPLSYASYNNKRLIQQSTVNGRNVGKVAAPYSNTAQCLQLERNEPLPYSLNSNKRFQQPSLNERNEQTATAPYSNNIRNPPVQQNKSLPPYPLYYTNTNERLIQQSSTVNGRNVGKVTAPYSNTAQYLQLQRNEPTPYPLNNNKRLIQQPPLNGRNEQTATAPYSNNVRNPPVQQNKSLPPSPSYTNTNERLIQQSSTVNGRNVRKIVAPYSNNAQYPHLQRNEPPPYPFYNNMRLIQQPSLNGRNEQIATAPYLNNAHYPPEPGFLKSRPIQYAGGRTSRRVQFSTVRTLKLIVQQSKPYPSQNTKQKLIPQVTTVNSANGHGNLGQVTTVPYVNNAHYPPVQKNALQQLAVMHASYNYNGNSVIQQTNSVQGSGFVPCASYTKGWYKCMCKNVRHNF